MLVPKSQWAKAARCRSRRPSRWVEAFASISSAFETTDNRQQMADNRQQMADNRQQMADGGANR